MEQIEEEQNREFAENVRNEQKLMQEIETYGDK